MPRLYSNIICKNIVKMFQKFEVRYIQTCTSLESNTLWHPKRAIVCFHPFGHKFRSNKFSNYVIYVVPRTIKGCWPCTTKCHIHMITWLKLVQSQNVPIMDDVFWCIVLSSHIRIFHLRHLHYLPPLLEHLWTQS